MAENMMREIPRDGQGRYEARVLVVEDDVILRAQLRHMVAKRVSEARDAADGAEGLASWRSWQPDLVITDIMMPVMDGLEMAAAIKQDDAGAQIIVVTSSAETEHLRQALDIGIDRYVLKPLDEPLLHDALHKCLLDLQRQRELHLARLVFESAGEGMMVTDETGRILAVNPSFCDVTGYREDEVLGQRASMLSSGRQDAEFYQVMWNSLRSVGRWAGEIVNRRKGGEVYTEWLSIVAVEEASRRATRYVGLFSDITEGKREEDRIRRLAHFDSLTGLPNRALLLDRMKRALVRLDRRGGDLALLYLDLDRFKPINDLYGHAFGDQVLAEVARRMSACVRDVDMVSRHGGDEFVILIEAADARGAAAMVAGKLINAISRPYSVWGREVSIGASVGVAIYPEDGRSADALLEAADHALYGAKREGRGDLRFFSQIDQQEARSRKSLEEALMEGMSEGRFEQRYLPEISLATGKVERLEALLRFRHPEHGLLEAGRFLDLAERLGIMPAVGLHSIRMAVQALDKAGLKAMGLTFDMTARQLAALGEPSPVLHWLERAGMSPQQISFEFREQAVSGNEEGMRVLYRLHEAGFGCGLDDFGAGFCSFSLLRQLPLSSLKIDLSFIDAMERSDQFRELVAALIAFGKRLGVRIVAEGVTCTSQLNFLRETGCDAVQGFLFGQPLEPDALTAYFEEQPWRQYF
jgi:diguanylate cyclase (GGDEF)-like protein/PAS domain S-box-containing protein